MKVIRASARHRPLMSRWFVAGLVGGRHTGVAKQAKIVSVGSSYGCEGGTARPTEAQVTARIVAALNWVARNARKPAVVICLSTWTFPRPSSRPRSSGSSTPASRLSPQPAMTVGTDGLAATPAPKLRRELTRPAATKVAVIPRTGGSRPPFRAGRFHGPTHREPPGVRRWEVAR
jgi:hypothetical protein